MSINVDGHAEVTSEALVELQSKVLKLSSDIHEMYDYVASNLNLLAEEWRDEKFMEFMESFESRKEKIAEISTRYEQWAKVPLQRVIDDVVRYEQEKAGI